MGFPPVALSETRLYDPYAELVVVGCAIDTPDGCANAHQHLEPDDFHDPVLADLFACAPTLHADNTTYTGRRAQAAQQTRVRPADVDAICDARPVMADPGGRYATRVADASRRRTIHHIVDAAAAAINNDDTDDAADALQTALTLIRTGR